MCKEEESDVNVKSVMTSFPPSDASHTRPSRTDGAISQAPAVDEEVTLAASEAESASPARFVVDVDVAFPPTPVPAF
jgi:hypothetical protein